MQRTIHDLARLGIRIKVISRDNRYVTAHLAVIAARRSRNSWGVKIRWRVEIETLEVRVTRADRPHPRGIGRVAGRGFVSHDDVMTVVDGEGIAASS